MFITCNNVSFKKVSIEPHHKKLKDHSAGFVSRKDRNQSLFIAILTALPLAGILIALIIDPTKEIAGFSEHPIGSSIFLSIPISLCIYFCSNYFLDKKIRLLISKDGIWTPSHLLMRWQSIEYIYVHELSGRITTRKIMISISEKEKEIGISIDDLDRTEKEIIEAILMFSKDYDVSIMDKEVKSIFW